jgi:hypothetical protein
MTKLNRSCLMMLAMLAVAYASIVTIAYLLFNLCYN